MARKRSKPRLYARQRGGEAPRYYGDFRDLGGGREPLRVEGQKLATTSLSVAEALLSDRVKQLERDRELGVLIGVRRRARLKDFAAEHLVEKAKSGRVAELTLVNDQHYLDEAVAHFGAERDLLLIDVPAVQEYTAHLRAVSNGRGATISAGTVTFPTSWTMPATLTPAMVSSSSPSSAAMVAASSLTRR